MTAAEHFDVLIVGAGLSGIGTAHHLQDALPTTSYAIFESRDAIGGTWDLFRFPGVRSDSDMQTLSYRFRPWSGSDAIASGGSILSYVRDTADEAGITSKVRFQHKVLRADWSSQDTQYTVTIKRAAFGDTIKVTCGFLFVAGGYYRYDEGFSPRFPGSERFAGTVIHPQHWPQEFDYAGKRVVVIGSGATAITLVPAMAEKAAHVTMLQRSPTYLLSLPSRDPLATALARVLPERLAYPITRWKNVAVQTLIYQLSQRRPKLVKRLIRKAQVEQLPVGYDIDTHLTPSYEPWDQRMCVVPDGDFFQAISNGSASVATDRVKAFTETGIELESGAVLEADVIVTATGLNLLAFGGIELGIDGADLDLTETLVYKGLMLSSVPNFVFTFGYTNASWTLKADLVAEYVCRLLAFMAKTGYRQAVPINDDPSVTKGPLFDFAAGYIQRSLAVLPHQGSRAPWRLGMNYPKDIVSLRHRKIDDGVLRFS